jgi:hypothetical protein
MNKYTINATNLQYLELTIEADSLEEAQRIAKDELIVMDFEQTDGEFLLTDVKEAN